MVVLGVDLPLLGELLLDYGRVVRIVVWSVGPVDRLVPPDVREGVRVRRADRGYGTEWW